MESAIPQERLTEILRDAQARTDVSRAAVALHVDGRTTFAGEHPRPFRVASITKSFTATAVSLAGLLDDRRRALLSHTAGYRPERPGALAGRVRRALVVFERGVLGGCERLRRRVLERRPRARPRASRPAAHRLRDA
jgi:CubicO group peptidase (beta-lactamase class C family)